MSALNEFILKVKRGESPFYRFMLAVLKAVFRPRPPRIPAFLRPPLRLLYEAHWFSIVVARMVLSFYRNPLFQSRCASVGKNLYVEGMPYVSGHVEIHLGDDVVFGGNVSISSGRLVDQPKLIMKDRSGVGWNTQIVVSCKVILEEDVIVSYDCRISDSDGHPREADRRANHEPPSLRDIRPVRICRAAWIGNGTHIMKGVTIGEGAIIGANSVVINDIPPYCLALGNPAEIYFHNYGRPKKGP